LRIKTTAKEEVRALLEKLPDDASLNDIQYHIYVRQKVERGLEAIQQGNVIPHEEIVKRMARWLEK
jgi:predicted transcriptional regulator